MLEWLIIGGGLQGTYLSHVLSAKLALPPDAIRVLDPHPDSLERWHATTANCRMRFLRSPAAHHIGLRTNELLDFARQHCDNWKAEFLEPYLRPSLKLWNEHAMHVIREHRLNDLRIGGSAKRVSRCPGGYQVETETHSLTCRRLILAVGNSQPLSYPALDQSSQIASERVRHVFDPQFRAEQIEPGEQLAIIGSGVTAAQLATGIAAGGSNEVTMLTDRRPFISWFDSDPGWNGPRLLSTLAAQADPVQRQEMISQARIRGSFPGDTAAALLDCQMQGRMRFIVARLQAVHDAAGRVQVIHDRGSFTVDRLVYATGFTARIPAATLVSSMSSSLGLPVTPAGWPVVNEHCEWDSGLYLSGALGQHELGPVARNISGVRSLGRRIIAQLAG